MHIEWKQLLLFEAIPLGTGGLSALLTREGMAHFARLKQPPLSPPAWVFPVVWTLLYLLMGLASYLVYTSGRTRREVRTALSWYAAQLAVNFFWSILFFGMERFLLAFFCLLLLWVLILVTTAKFDRIRTAAGYLLSPYLIWVTFAGYLNLGVYVLNP